MYIYIYLHELAKIKMNQNFSDLKIIHFVHPRYHAKEIVHILKNKQENKCIFIYKIPRFIIMKKKMKIKNRWHYDINRLSSRRENKFEKYKKCLSIMLFLYVKQQLSNN